MALDDGRTEYRNETQGWLGAIKINRKGDELAVSIAPGATVFLSDEEVELTARSHIDPKDSPFLEREVTFYDLMTRDPVETKTITPLTRVEEKRATGAAQEPADEASKGEHAPDEEVGTPAAPAAKKRPARRRATAGSR